MEAVKRKKDQEMDTQEGVRSTLSPRPIGGIDMVMHSSCMHAHVQTHALKTFMLASLLPLFFPQPRPSHPSLSSSAAELILPRMQIIKTNQQGGRYVLCALLKKKVLCLSFCFLPLFPFQNIHSRSTLYTSSHPRLPSTRVR